MGYLKKITLTISLSADKPSRMLVEQEGSLKTTRSSRFVYKLFSYSPNISSSLSPETDLKCGVLLSGHKFEGSLSDRMIILSSFTVKSLILVKTMPSKVQ